MVLDKYKDIDNQKVAFDISPTYFIFPEVYQTIYEFNPDAKVILVIREPAQWVYSLYKQQMLGSLSKLSFKEFLERGAIVGFSSKKPKNIKFYDGMIEDSVEKAKKAFGKNLLIYDFEEFNKNPLKFLNLVEDFCGIENYFNKNNFTNHKINSGDRQTSKLINSITKQKWFIDLITSVLPKKLISSVRNYYDYLGSKRIKKTSELIEIDIEFIRTFFKKDILFYNNFS
ncbi:MAG: sulfotransferase domain-containing protein [Bacteroidales bacterium]|nr:sulfotransferase domain-containing protein [Bacteroidales bacterium]MBN2757955.1 sulfotransferase domain-containing protein [Bacteroidales bacterium]